MPNLAEVDFTRLAQELKSQGAELVNLSTTRLIVNIPPGIERVIFQCLTQHPVTRRYEEGLYIIEKQSLHKSAYIPGFRR